MNREHVLLATPQVRLVRFDHPSDHAHHDPPRETASGYSISFIQRGGFHLRAGRRSWWMHPGTVFFTWPGLEYRCSHLEKHPADVCLSISFGKDFAAALCRRLPGQPMARPVLPRTSRLAYLAIRLAALARSGDAFETEPLAAELFAAAVSGDTLRPVPYREAQLRWYADRVDAARARLEAAFREPHSLAELAHEVGMSPFHFARIFRELAGKPPHRYLLNVRLREAARCLQEGSSVTAACFDCGFTSVSHFTRVFRREFGVMPSRFRSRPKN